ncbi:DeoR family transcriptional regulator, partial [Enterococcus faecalis]
MTEKSIKNSHEKHKIPSFAPSCVQDGDMIYLDAGSNTLVIIPFLVGNQIHVVTNSVHHAAKRSVMEIPTI